MAGWAIAGAGAMVLLGALAIFVAGSLACGLASSMAMLIGSRVLQGLGGGGLMVLSQALIGELVAPAERPRYQGYFAAVFTVSSVGGPVIGGFVVNHGDWRWLFLVNLPLGVVAAWRVLRLARPSRPRCVTSLMTRWGSSCSPPAPPASCCGSAWPGTGSLSCPLDSERRTGRITDCP